MSKIVVKELIFDEWNRKHIRKHKIVEVEIREAGKNLIYHKHSYEGRYLAIGWSGSRLVAMVLNRKASGKYYVVTARDASKKERRKVYDKENQ